jgi:hypothetical protein
MKRLLNWRSLLVYTHRWLGIAGCVLFVAWFASGVVMMYARMPAIAAEERLARAPALDLSRVTVSLADAAAAAGLPADGARVVMLQDRPAYRFGSRAPLIVFADDGTSFDGLDRNGAEAAARRWLPGHDGPLRYAAYLTEPDQWTLQARQLLPMHQFAVDDADDTHLYVSEVTGEVALRTTAKERFWAYLGPVTHWVYFTPLRRNGPLWSEFVIWSSLVGCVMCVSGLVWGLLRYSPRGRFRIKRVPASSPYVGMMKWHHYAGLLFGVVTLTWTYSGLLSMGPFNWFETGGMTRAQREASTGGPLQTPPLTTASMQAALAAFQQGHPPKELELLQFRGEPFWVADRAPAADQAGTWMHAGLWPRAERPRLAREYVSAVTPQAGVRTSFGREPMLEIARAAMPDIAMRDAVWLDDYDGYYYDARGSRTLPVLRVRYDDPVETWLYLDPKRGGIVQRSESTSRLRRWLYQGLHSLDFPALYFKRPLWDVVVIGLSLGGIVLSVVSLLPAWRRLRRHATGWSTRVRAALVPGGRASAPRHGALN